MQAMMWFYFVCLDPIFRVLYVPCDWVLGWVANLPPVAAIAVVGLFTGLGVNLFQKFCSDQKTLGRCKSDLDRIKALTRQAKAADDKDLVARLTRLGQRISGKYAGGSLKPALWTVPPVIVAAMWIGSRLGFEPIRPGQSVDVIANFEDDASGFASIAQMPGVIEFVSPAVSAVVTGQDTDEDKERRRKAAEEEGVRFWYKPSTWFKTETQKEHDDRIKAAVDSAPSRGVEARWKIRPLKPGRHTLRISHAGQEYLVDFPVSASGGRPPEIMNFFRFTSPRSDQLQMVCFTLKDSMPAAWWNLSLRWMGVYLLVAVAFGVGLRFALGVK